MTTWMRTAVLAAVALWCNGTQAQSPPMFRDVPIPKELDGWQAWVLDGQDFLRCPIFANGSRLNGSAPICVWPGRLTLDLNQEGGRFTQSWTSYADAWLPLPGSLEHWPSSVTVNGAAAAVVARAGVAQIRVAAGSYTVAGNFLWTKRPESLSIPQQTGLVTLTLDGHKIDQVDRPDGAVWLGKRHETAAAQQFDVQVYRLLSDGIPLTLNTRLILQVAGDAREETLPQVLPPGFEPMSLDGELPVRLDADGRLRVQVRAGTWTVTVTARAAADLAAVTIPTAQAPWPKQEVWNYAANDRLRVAALEGAEGIDSAQANVPPEWRAYPSYRVVPRGVMHLVERSRGASSEEGNHLSLRRELYLDFAHQGFTAVDHISGQMRSGWRLDMQAPYRLMRASSGTDDLLVTDAASPARTGVELRSPELNLSTVARIAAAGGSMAASGWLERFEHVGGVLNLPPGHRLFAALGADSAPGAWVERWGLLDLFLLLIATVIAWRLFGWVYGAVTIAAVALVHQDEPLLVYLILSVLLVIVLGRAVPSGWARSTLTWVRNLALGGLLLLLVPFAITQLRFALYPQLADSGGYALSGSAAGAPSSSMAGAPVEIAQIDAPMAAAPAAAPPPGVASDAAAPPPRRKFAPPMPMSAPALQEIVVTGAKRSVAATGVSRFDAQQRYAPGTLVQAGPGIPHWRYAAYAFNWSGPVDAAQTVHFIILPPWVMAVWRIASVALLAALFLRLIRGSVDLEAGWRGLLAARTTALRGAAVGFMAVAWACTMCAPSHAADTPDRELLNELRSRLSRPPACVPNCGEIMAARLVLTPTSLDASFEVAALSSVSIPLLSVGQQFQPDAVSIDGSPVPGLYRDSQQQIWIAVKPGAHTVKLSGRLPVSDAVQLLFPQVPRGIAVSGEGWDVSGINAGRLLGNTLELLRRRAAGQESEPSLGGSQFPPFVRIHREFSLDLDWSLQTTVERLAPEKGGFTLEVPLLAGESVLSSGVETNNGTQVSAAFDSTAAEFSWRSGLAQSGTLTLTAANKSPWSEVWSFHVSPLWRVAFSGVPEVLPENLDSGPWTFEYFPRAGETLTLHITRPAGSKGGTLAFDSVNVALDVGKRSTSTTLELAYRSTQGGRHTVRLPAAARVTEVTVDGQAVAIRPEKSQLPLGLLPGEHRVQIKWQSDEGARLRMQVPDIDLELPASNVTTVVRLPDDRWVLYVGGGGVGPAILYWGELLVFAVLAFLLGRRGRTPLLRHEWLLLGLGLSTFSWSALLLFLAWIFAMRWREGLAVDQLSDRRFNLLQLALILLSLVAVATLVAAIPYGLLATPDMRIAGAGQYAHELSWFDDQAPGILPTPWVLSLSLWWYKAAMLMWALWLAFALVRWLPPAWRALGVGGFWRRGPRSPAPVAGHEPGNETGSSG